MRSVRSASSAQAASFSLNSSSEMLTQLSASARAPVTVPTLAVSLEASIRLLIGSASPKVPVTPAAMSPHFATSSSDFASCAKSWAASVALSVSPRIEKRVPYASFAVSVEYPAASNAVLSLPCAARYSSVETARSFKNFAPATAAVPTAAKATPAALAPAASPFFSLSEKASVSFSASLTSFPYWSMDFAQPSALAAASSRYWLFFWAASERLFCSIFALLSCCCQLCTPLTAAALAASASCCTFVHFSISAVNWACSCWVSPVLLFSFSSSAAYCATFFPASA